MRKTWTIRSRPIGVVGLVLLLIVEVGATAQVVPYQSSADFEKFARMLRENALLKIEPSILIPSANRPLNRPRYPWKNNIVTTLFWTDRKMASAWDAKWAEHFGGFDNPNPAARRGFFPVAFVPRLNPFYCSLPYNDIAGSTAKPEAKAVIPWFTEAFEREGKSVCRDRWVRIRNRSGRDCFAQWSDCGPFRADHWQYVFGDERPRPNANQGAGLGVSPAVRDFLSLSSTDVTDWQFVEFKDVPRGPWSMFGENNPFVENARKRNGVLLQAVPGVESSIPGKEPASAPEQRIILR